MDKVCSSLQVQAISGVPHIVGQMENPLVNPRILLPDRQVIILYAENYSAGGLMRMGVGVEQAHRYRLSIPQRDSAGFNYQKLIDDVESMVNSNDVASVSDVVLQLAPMLSSGIVEIPVAEWNSLWSTVDNVWRIESRKKKEWKLVCRLKKTTGVPKRRKTVHISNVCSASATVKFERNDVVIFQIHSPHSHSLDLSDTTRKNSYVLKFVKEEINRGYDAESVISLVKKKAIAYNYLGLKYVTMTYLRSLQKKVTSSEEQEPQTVEGVLLTNQFQVFKSNLPCGRLIAFMNSAQLELIRKYGNGVVFMDSTEKTNSKKYYYVTAVVRTDERKWMPLFQFWTSSEHSELGYDAESVISLVKKKAIAYNYLGFRYLPLSYLRTLQNKSPGNEELEQNSVGSVLLSNQYQMFTVSLPSGRAFAFLHPKQLDLLRVYGNRVVVMDSTEKTNSKKYHYATAVIRTDERKWMPAFQFWISAENGELYSACLKWILEKSGSSWEPACFVIDRSRMEEKAVVAVFGNSTKVFNCTRHSMETLKSRLGHTPVALEGMKRALFASSYRECLSSLQFAVDSCPYEELKRYIQRAWPMERGHIWSLHARREGQMAEVTTTNPVESFFSRVKKVVNVNMSLQEATSEIVKLLHGMFEKMTEIKEKELVTCIVGVEKIHTFVSSWTLSNQKLILKEFETAQKYISEGTLDFLYIQAKQDETCKCRFYRFNQMPCSHILGRNIVSNGGFINEEYWNVLRERFQ
ncbi:hypothetical protein MP638_005559 [Amoeboaphelidium occidentale]|nr:hypothetical protein MP638_005559 [Amoeboaphelidium occidentale]